MILTTSVLFDRAEQPTDGLGTDRARLLIRKLHRSLVRTEANDVWRFRTMPHDDQAGRRTARMYSNAIGRERLRQTATGSVNCPNDHQRPPSQEFASRGQACATGRVAADASPVLRTVQRGQVSKWPPVTSRQLSERRRKANRRRYSRTCGQPHCPESCRCSYGYGSVRKIEQPDWDTNRVSLMNQRRVIMINLERDLLRDRRVRWRQRFRLLEHPPAPVSGVCS
jgi:hypothetical protein